MTTNGTEQTSRASSISILQHQDHKKINNKFFNLPISLLLKAMFLELSTACKGVKAEDESISNPSSHLTWERPQRTQDQLRTF